MFFLFFMCYFAFMKISVVIQTYNSERYLRRVLEAVKAFDEIVICDMHSTDRTTEIASEFGCKIVFHEKRNYCEPARNFAIQSASYDWVLVVDSDELVTNELRTYLYEQIIRENCPEGIRIPRKNFFMGRFMHGDYPDYNLRFVRKEKTNWPIEIHSVPQIEGKIETIPRSRKELALIHLINSPLNKRIEKVNIYTDMEIPKRKNKKYSVLAILYAPIHRFIKSYVIKGGFRDGKAGFVYAYMDAFYKFTTIAKLWENELTDKDIDPLLKASTHKDLIAK